MSFLNTRHSPAGESDFPASVVWLSFVANGENCIGCHENVEFTVLVVL